MRFILLLSLVFNLDSLHSQVYEAKFNQHFHFENGRSYDFYKLIQEDSLITDVKRFGNNKYVFDLSKNEAKLYFQGSYIRSVKIQKSKLIGDILHLECEDTDLNSGLKMPIYCALNIGNDYSLYPYFTFFFESAGKIEGYNVSKKGD